MKPKSIFLTLLLLFGLNLIGTSQDVLKAFEREKGLLNFFEKIESAGIDPNDRHKWIFSFRTTDSLALSLIMQVLLKLERQADTSHLVFSSHGFTQSLFIDTVFNRSQLSAYQHKIGKVIKRSPVVLTEISIEPLSMVQGMEVPEGTSTNILEEIAAQVRSSETHKAIPFAVFYVPRLKDGAIADALGNFSFRPPKDQPLKILDSLEIRCVGFETKKMLLDDLLKNESVIILDPSVHSLEQVVVEGQTQAKSIFFEKLRNTRQSGIIQGGSFGAEAAQLFNQRSDSIYITELAFYLKSKRPFSMQCKVYLQDSLTRLPGRILHSKPILLSGDGQNGWVHVSVSELSLVVNQPFFVSIQWLEGRPRHPMLGIRRKKAFFRSGLTGKWEHTKEFGWLISGKGTLLD